MTYNPYERAFPAPSFTLISSDFADGDALPLTCYAPERGDNRSPQLSWSNVPEGTKSFVLTAFDPDAPIPGGLWHWLVKDIPATSTGLDAGVASADLPDPAVLLVNDLGQAAYSGVQPPPGTGVHRLVICLTALSVPAIRAPDGASTALLNILMIQNTLGRALLTGTSQPE